MKKYLMLISVFILFHSNASAEVVKVSDQCATISLSGPDTDTGGPYTINAAGISNMGGSCSASFFVDGRFDSTISSRTSNIYKQYGPFQGGHKFNLVFETSSCKRSTELVVKNMDPKKMAADVCTSIKALPDSAFNNNPNQRKKAFCAKTDEVVSLISSAESSTNSTDKTQYYQTAIDKLQNDIAAKMDSHLGGQPNNDWITDELSQKPIYNSANDLINILKSLK